MAAVEPSVLKTVKFPSPSPLPLKAESKTWDLQNTFKCQHHILNKTLLNSEFEKCISYEY